MNRPTDKQIDDVLAGVASAEEARQVARWLATEEGSKYIASAFDRDAQAIAQTINPGDEELYVPHPIPSEEVWVRIRKQLLRYRLRRVMFRVAVVLIPVLVLVGLYTRLESRVDLFGDVDYEEVYVPKGERLQMMFQDGTKVYINSDTRLRYPKKFGLDSRNVELSGEAYFVVAKNKKRPFVVQLDGPSIHVVGTSFNVQDYPEDDKITVSLDEGKINMHFVSDKEIPLSAGQQAVYDRKHDTCQVLSSSNIQYFSLWKQNIISFKDLSLSEVIVKLQRWYNVEFKVEGKIPDDLLITLTSNQTILENVLRDLEKITPLTFDYDVKSKIVWIRRKSRF